MRTCVRKLAHEDPQSSFCRTGRGALVPRQCEAAQWRAALELFRGMAAPDGVSFTAAISACAGGGQYADGGTASAEAGDGCFVLKE